MPPRPTTLPTLAVLALVSAAALPAAAGAASGGVSATSGATAPAAPAPEAAPSGSSAPATRRVTNARPSRIGVVRLASSKRVSLRRDPNVAGKAGSLPNGARIRISCQTNGSPVSSSRYGRSRVWNRVRLNGRNAFVPDAYVETSSKDALVAPFCGFPDPPAPAAGTNPGKGRCSSVATVALDRVPADRAAFVDVAGPLARASKAATGVPAAVTLAQGILESGSGRFTAGANNYFGIKAQAAGPGVFSWGTSAIGCIHKQTNEVEGGTTVRRIAEFRMYAGMRESFDDHGLFLRQNSRYAPAFAHTDDPEAFAKAVHRAGYATDPGYSAKLIKLMNDPAVPLLGYEG